MLSEYHAVKANAHAVAKMEAKQLMKAMNKMSSFTKDLKARVVSQNAQICFWNRFLRGKAIAMLEAACRERQIDGNGSTRRFAYTYFIDGDTYVDVHNPKLFMSELEEKHQMDPFVDPVFTGYLTIRSVLINGGSGMLFNAAAMDKMCAPEALDGCLRVGLDEHGASVAPGHFDNPMDGGDMRTAVCAAKFAGLTPSRTLSLRSNLLFRPDPPWVKADVWRRLYYLVNADMKEDKYDPIDNNLSNGGRLKDIDNPKVFPAVSFHHVRAVVRKGYKGSMRHDTRCYPRATLVGWSG